MPYAWNGTCYETPEAALRGFSRDIPKSDGSAITAFSVAPTVDQTGLVSWSINHRPLNGDTVTTRTGTTQLLPCDLDGFSLQSQPDLIFLVAIVFAWAVGFRTGVSV